MDPQSFIVGFMASISVFGGSILVAMVVLERPRYGLRCWPWRQRFRQGSSQGGLEADDPHLRLRQSAVLERMQRRRAKRRRQGLAQKHNPANRA